MQGLGHLDAAPYGCSQLINRSTDDYNTACLDQAGAMAAYARASGKAGKVAPIARMAGARVWVMSGSADTIVHPGIGRTSAAFYAVSRRAVEQKSPRGAIASLDFVSHMNLHLHLQTAPMWALTTVLYCQYVQASNRNRIGRRRS